MKEIIIIKTDQGEKIKNFLEKEKFSYKVYQEPKDRPDKEQLRDKLIAAYERQAKNKKLQSELAL
jgi:hypothetical protein